MSLSTIGRKVNLDRVDSCNEVVLGASCTCCVSLLIAAVVLPVLEYGGLGWVKSWEGGHVNMETYWRALEDKYKSPKEAFEAIDANHDGVLNKDEFTNSSALLKPSFTEREAKRIRRNLDSDGDHVVSADEFYSASPAGIPDAWKVIATTTTTVSAVVGSTSSVASSTGEVSVAKDELTDKELDSYVGVPAIISGSFQGYLTLPSTEELPSAADMKDALEPSIKRSLGEFFGSKFEAGELEVIGANDDEYPDSATHVHRTAKLTFEVDTKDAGTVQKDLKDKSVDLLVAIDTALQREKPKWLIEGTKLTFYLRIEVSYGGGAESLPKGSVLVQESGELHEDDGSVIEHSGTPPYTETQQTRRSLRG